MKMLPTCSASRGRALRLFPLFFLSAVFLFWFAHGAAAAGPSEEALEFQGQATYDIGIVTDGDTVQDRQIARLFQKEISSLAEGEFRVRFPRALRLSGRDTAKGARVALDRLLADPRADLVLTLGPIATTAALRRNSLPKPVVAPFVVDGVLKKKDADATTSGIPNLTYVNPLLLIEQEVRLFRKIVSFKKLAVLVDRRELEAIPEINKHLRKLANEYTIDVVGVPVGTSAAEALDAIPPGTDAVMVAALYHMDEAERKELIKGLIKRRLPSYALWNRKLVNEGVLATDVPADMGEKLARRTAVSVQDILLGEPADSLDVTFSRGSQLTINMATARALDVYPSLAVLTGANLLNEERLDIKRRINLQQAVNEALQANLDLTSAEYRVRAGVHAVTEARSALLPQIGASTGARAIDEDRAALGAGTTPERAWTGSLGGSQQIYSERSWAGYTVEQHRQTGREMDRDTVRLDIMYQASTAYLAVLRAKTIERLYKDNLKLTLANLDRARIRLSTGVAGPDEVYRWETKFATDKIVVLEKESLTMDAMEALNRILNRPLQERFIAEETDLSDPLLIAGDKLFFDMMNNPRYLEQFRSFALAEALACRTELKSVDAAIAAKERLKTAAGRSFWLPEITVEGNVDQYFAEDGSGQRGDFQDGLDDTDWQVGVYARLPLFEGGRRSGELNRTREELARLKTDRLALAERIGQEMLRALNRTRASYPGISLSREAADAAQRNLTLITDSYVQGIKSIIDLLDAQNQALTAEQGAANAVYNFLVDLMGVQRAMGEFVLFLPKDQREAWRDRAMQYLQEKSGVRHKR
jgi:outer membrane protein TolC